MFKKIIVISAISLSSLFAFDFSNALDKVTNKGIKPTTGIPGANLDNSPIGNGSDSKTKSKVNESIATGGQKHNYITINLKDLIGVLNISGKDFKDSSNQMQQQTEDALMRVLAMATTAGI